jgi:hypothetical protein
MAHENQLVKSVALAAVVLLMSGCDSAFRIHGVAPQDGSCIVNVVDKERDSIYESYAVVGEFTETVIVGGGWNTPTFTVAAECSGVAVKSVENVTPNKENYERPIELGIIEP